MANQEDLYAYYEDENNEESVDTQNEYNNSGNDSENQEYYDDYSENDYEYNNYNEEEYYYDEDEYKKERTNKIICICLYVILMFFAIIGVLALALPHVRNALFSTFS